LVGIAARISNNIYVLSEIGNEKYCLGKEDKSWLWHRRMGHRHFDNLVKVSKRVLDLLHTHLGFLFPKVFICLLVIIIYYPVSYILGENIPPGRYSLSVHTSI
jgi:hypothetical protein